MRRFDEGFPLLLHDFKLDTLENDPNSIFGLTRELKVNYVNPGWFEFARKNGGEPAISDRFSLGADMADAITGTVRGFYLDAFREVLTTGAVWSHDYECSSPETYRLYHQSVYPLKDGAGLIVVNSLAIEQPHDPTARAPHEPISDQYLAATGVINQCCNCRRTQRAVEPEVWDWVPVLVSHMPHNTSHGLCRICFDFYYGTLRKA